MAGRVVTYMAIRALTKRLDARRAARRPPRPTDTVEETAQAREARKEAALERARLGRRLVRPPELLERMLTVRPGTVAFLLEQDLPVQVKGPGERLRPPWLPRMRPVEVMVINTEDVNLDLSIDSLTTMDGRPVTGLVVRITLRLGDTDRYAALADLAAELGGGLESHLLQRVQAELTNEITAAVRMNRLADLRRLELERLLTERWLPRTFADGLLVRQGFGVREVGWPDAAEAGSGAPAEPARPRPAALGAATSTPPSLASPTAGAPRPEPVGRAAQTGTLDLTVNQRLRQLWRRNAGGDVRGIAGAKLDGGATVIAVAEREPPAYETTMLREAFGKSMDDRNVHMVVAVGGSYDEVVRSWFRQVTPRPGRLVAVQSDGHQALRISVDEPSRSPDGRSGPPVVGTAADREALRQLLPHETVEFAASTPNR